MAKGPKRTFCRKAKNATRKRAARDSPAKIVSRGRWKGYNRRQVRLLKSLGHKRPPTGHLHVPKDMKREFLP